MLSKFDYTTMAGGLVAKYPTLFYICTQVIFWIIANLLLVSILYLEALAIGNALHTSLAGSLLSRFFIACILGVLNGFILGWADIYLDKSFFRKKALGKIILFKTVISLAVIISQRRWVQKDDART